MLQFLTNGIRRVLGLLDETEADLAVVEERLASIAERAERAEFHITELSERFLAMAGQQPGKHSGRNGANRNGKATRRRAVAKRK